jgi:hypothetical protein
VSESEGTLRSCWTKGFAMLRTPGEDRQVRSV